MVQKTEKQIMDFIESALEEDIPWEFIKSIGTFPIGLFENLQHYILFIDELMNRNAINIPRFPKGVE